MLTISNHWYTKFEVTKRVIRMTDNTMAKEKENQQLEKKNSIEKYA
jgi:hypothetical protein